MKNAYIRAVWLVLAVVICPGLAAMAVGPDDDNTTVWSGSRVLDREYVVPKGSTLRIEPGTVIQARKAWNARIVVCGKLLAVGTKAKPIEFRPAKPHYWGGIRFEGAKSGGRLEHCIVIGARRSAVRCDASSPTIRNCRFETGSYKQGWILCENGARPLIERNVIKGGGAAGVLCRGAAPTIRGNTFDGAKIGIQIFDMAKCPARPTIEDNTHKKCLLAVFDQESKTPQQWTARFSSKVLTRTLALSVAHADGRDVVSAYAGGIEGITERRRIKMAVGAVIMQTEKVKVKPGTIPPAATSFKLAGRNLSLKTIATGGGLLGVEGCNDTSAAYAVLIDATDDKAPGRLLWRSPKYDRGRLHLVPADLDGDGTHELVVCTGRWCEGKGRIFVYGLTRRASSPATTQPTTQAATGAALEGEVRRLAAQLGDNSYQVREAATKELIGMGQKVLPVLEKMDMKVGAEAQRRLETVLYALVGWKTDLTDMMAMMQLSDDETRPEIAMGLVDTVRGNQPQTGDFLVELIEKSDPATRRRAIGAFVAAWDVTTPAQMERYLRASVRTKVKLRPQYPQGVGAYIGMSYHLSEGWVSLPADHRERPKGKELEVKTTTIHYLDGNTYGTPFVYPHVGSGAGTGCIRVGKLAKGKHTVRLTTEYTLKHQGQRVAVTVASKPHTFEVVSADAPDDLAAKPDAALDDLVKSSLRIRNQLMPGGLGGRPFNGPRRVDASGDIADHAGPQPQVTWRRGKESGSLSLPVWELRQALPVDLCFEVSIQETGNGKVHRGDPMVILAGKGGKGFNGYFVPNDCWGFAAGRDGNVEVKIILKPSRARALTEIAVKHYYTGTITSKPVLVRVKNISSPRPAKPPATQPAATG